MDYINTGKLMAGAYAMGLFICGYILAKQVSRLVERAMSQHFSRHHVALARRSTFYLILALFSISGLQHMGFNLSVLLGAAGVFTVAISFASQTAASNLISGIFLLFERPFKIGDNIEIKGINGIVESIDLLSTKIKTLDNKLVRIPNEGMMKSEISNLSYFSTRRIELIIGVAYNTDLEQVKSILMHIASLDEQVLKDPAPCVIVNQFADSAIQLKYLVWVPTTSYTAVKSDLQEQIKLQFDRAGIEIPFPQVAVHRINS